MVTGDLQKTAAAIGAELGLLTPETPHILTGSEWEALPEAEQRRRVKRTGICPGNSQPQALDRAGRPRPMGKS